MPSRWEPRTARSGKSQAPSPHPGVADVPCLDPYFRWARHTDWRGFQLQAGWDQTPGDNDRVQIIAQASTQKALDAAMKCRELDIPPTYRREVPGTNQRALHFTAWVKRDRLAWLASTELGLRWELSQPLRDAEVVAGGSALGRFGPQRDKIAFRPPNVLGPAISAAVPPVQVLKPSEVLAVIDFGCPFLNSRFSELDQADATRVVALWDQGSAIPPNGDRRLVGSAWPWSCPPTLGYGREIKAHVLHSMVSAVQAPGLTNFGVLEESEAYRSIDYMINYDDARRRVWYATHGGHVLDVIGGALNPLTGKEDAASRAKLIFVQLPSMTAGDSSGASLSSHLLDGVRYVLDQSDEQARIVINISYGSYAGPHDGSSLIELALDELLEARERNFAIVLAAGNSRRKSCHALRQVRPQRSALLRCALAAGDTTDTFIEIWYGLSARQPVLQVRARPPGGVWSRWLDPGEEQLLRDTAVQEEVVAMLRHDAHVPNGNKSLIVLALAPTAQPADIACALADPGLWEIEVAMTPAYEQSDALPVSIDAYIERDDAGQNLGAGLHRFLDQDFDDNTNTLSSLATGKHTVVVGGFRRSDRRLTDYTSVGSKRGADTLLPMVLGVCEEDDVNPSVAAAATRSNEVFRMQGTSVGAPVVARQLFGKLSESEISRTGWKKALNELAAREVGDVRLLED